jgi:hypothetical protein
MDHDMHATGACRTRGTRGFLLGLAWLVGAEMTAVAVLGLVALGCHFSGLILQTRHSARPGPWGLATVWTIGVAGSWPGIHVAVWVAARVLKRRCGEWLIKATLACNIACAPVLLFYAWRPVVTVLITHVPVSGALPP